MGKVDVAWNTFLDTLNSELKEIEERTFKRSDWASVAAARDKMIGVMRSPESRRYERGLAVRDYRNQYRRNGGELAWRDDDGAGAKIARIEENTTAKSADHWIKDAEFAEPLGDLLRDAMLACNCDPTLRKNKDIVNPLMEQDGPKNLEEARKLVEKVIAEKSSRKRAQPVSASERRERLANRVTDFIINQPTRTWDVTREEIFELVKAKVETEEEERRAVVEREPRAIARRADAM